MEVELFGKRFFYKGNIELLKKPLVAIVGSRRPIGYTKINTSKLALGFANRGYVVVSGAAMGVDAIAHRGAGAQNTIAILPCGIDVVYPKVNASLIKEIGENGLLLSPFEKGFKATKWSFVVRNEYVIRLSSLVIITEADKNSGSLTSAEYAKKYKKDIFVLPHRLGESEGTNGLLQSNEAKAVFDIDEFLAKFGKVEKSSDKIEFLKSAPTYEEALLKLKDELFELELEGIIEIINGKVVYRGEL